jgi:hypothetical protein
LTDKLNGSEADERRRQMNPEPFLVVCFGTLSYKVLGEYASEDKAEAVLATWEKRAARPGGVEVLPISHHCTPGDFQVRQQSDLDDLTRAIISSYPPYERER